MASDSDAPRTVLVSLRDADDPMCAHELACFRRATGIDAIEMVSAVNAEGRALDALEDAVASAELLLFGGSGAYSVLDTHSWVRRFLDVLARVPSRGVPAWASCFAFQGLALAMGGRVARDDARQQLGARPVELTAAAGQDPLFASLPPRFFAQFGHHDHVVDVPSGVTVLATGNGGQCQAFRVDGARFWGAQFHPELDKRTTLERWSHYRLNYERDQGDEIDRQLREAPETPEVSKILRTLVELARER